MPTSDISEKRDEKLVRTFRDDFGFHFYTEWSGQHLVIDVEEAERLLKRLYL